MVGLRVFSIEKGSGFAPVSSLWCNRRRSARLGVLTAGGEAFSVRRDFVLSGQPPAMRHPVRAAIRPGRHVVGSPHRSQYWSVGSEHT
jgi:hypothetical protein